MTEEPEIDPDSPEPPPPPPAKLAYEPLDLDKLSEGDQS
jgi:hypothetical protein